MNERYAGRIAIMCGSDDQAVDYFFWGVRSWLAGTANVLPRQHVDILNAANSGDLVGARKQFEQIMNAHRVRRCAEEATARAVAQVNSPALTRYYEEKNGSAYRDMPDIVAAKKMRPDISSM